MLVGREHEWRRARLGTTGNHDSQSCDPRDQTGRRRSDSDICVSESVMRRDVGQSPMVIVLVGPERPSAVGKH